jgi:hypothetical protein
MHSASRGILTTMERAPLRPVPSRPAGPVTPAEAVRFVEGELPTLDQPAAAALALVALVGRPRAEVATAPDLPEAGDLSEAALADALFRARKALRRKLHPLPGSGWCERAERLISDRLDDALKDPGPARLEVHLANCSRCVEHERRLGQAHEALVAGFEGAHPEVEEPEPEPAAPPEAPAVEPSPPLPVLRAVETPALPAASPNAELPPPESPTEALPEAPAAEALPDAEQGPEVAAAEPVEELPPPDEPSQPVETPAAAVPVAQRLSSSPLPTPAAPSPSPVAPSAAPPPAPRTPAPPAASPTVPSTPPQNPPSDPPPTPPSAGSWSQPQIPQWPQTSYTTPAAWRTDSSRPALAARTALEAEDEWSAIGALVAVLGVAVVIGLVAVLLAVG